MATKIGVSAASPGDEKPKAMLTKEEVMRYSRHLIMPEVGMEGQLKINAAKVLCIGTGGLGAPLGLYLAAAGWAESAWWILMSLIPRIFSARFSLAPATWASPKPPRLRIACEI